MAQVAHECARQGLAVTVISPIALHRAHRPSNFPLNEEEIVDTTTTIRIIRPRYFGASAWASLSFLGRYSPTRITDLRFTAAARRALRSLEQLPDALYGHFLYFGGAAAVRLGSELELPAFPCVGEGVLWTVDRFGDRVATEDLRGATGMIVNNSDLARTVSRRLGYPLEKMLALPNGVDTKRFRPLNKFEARLHFGLPRDTFIVGSVGNFTHEKGIHRLAQAIDGIPGIVGAYAGSGDFVVTGSNVAFCKRVPHDEMPLFLSACDLFVLPTLVEGSSNATLEAMACGLPVVGADLPFNDDLLDDQMSIRINPLDIPAISGVIEALRTDDVLRTRMSRQARIKAESLDIALRAKRMLTFMSNLSTEN